MVGRISADTFVEIAGARFCREKEPKLVDSVNRFNQLMNVARVRGAINKATILYNSFGYR
jgi:hypothetical protein